MSDDKQLNAKEVAEVVGMHRNTWSSLTTRGYAPRPDGYTESGQRHPWWWESTIRDFLRWKADPVLSRAPSMAERFANWQKRQRAGAVLGGDPLPVDQSDEDRERGNFTEQHIRGHRSFVQRDRPPVDVRQMTDELRLLILPADRDEEEES